MGCCHVGGASSQLGVSCEPRSRLICDRELALDDTTNDGPWMEQKETKLCRLLTLASAHTVACTDHR
jgi:hypothetical protein